MSPLRMRVMEALLTQGPWVQRAVLDRLTTSALALEDVLADLVIEGAAEFKPSVGYRACGSPLVRHARAQLVRDPSVFRHVAAREEVVDGKARLMAGFAVRTPGQAVEAVAFELELPPAGSPDELIAQGKRLLDLCGKGDTHG